jgi:hypothetical protein
MIGAVARFVAASLRLRLGNLFRISNDAPSPLVFMPLCQGLSRHGRQF